MGYDLMPPDENAAGANDNSPLGESPPSDIVEAEPPEDAIDVDSTERLETSVAPIRPGMVSQAIEDVDVVDPLLGDAGVDGGGEESFVDVDSGASPALGETLPLAFGFEDGFVPNPWVENSGVVTLDGDSFTGQSSLLATSALEGAQATAGIPFEAQFSGALYVRAWYKIDGALTGRLNLLGLKSAPGDGSEQDVVDVNVSTVGPNAKLDIYFHQQPSARGVSTPMDVPLGEWVCLETALVLSDSVGQVTVRVEDELGNTDSYATTADRDTLTPDGLNVARFGIDWTESGQTATVVRVDDLVIDTQPIGCQ